MEKKTFYKKKSVWIIAVIVIIVIASATSDDSTTTTTTEVVENNITSTPKVTNDVAEDKETKTKDNTSETKDDNSEKKDKNSQKKDDATEKKDDTTKPETTPVDVENMSEEEQEKFLSDLTKEIEESSQDIEAELEEKYEKDTKAYRFYAALEENEVCPYTMSDKASEFLIGYPEFFSTTKLKKITNYVDYDISYKHIAKNASKYGDKLMCISPAYVISCSETDIDDETTLTELQLEDEGGNSYMVIYIGSVDVFENDVVECYGLPLGTTSFDNISGGTTLAIVVAGSYISKID